MTIGSPRQSTLLLLTLTALSMACNLFLALRLPAGVPSAAQTSPAGPLPSCASCCPKPVPCRPLDMKPAEPPEDMPALDMSCVVCKDADGGSIGPCTPSRCAMRPDGSYCCIGGELHTWPYHGSR